jgi:hypothetical protein
MNFGLFILRLVVGLLMAAHGSQKVFGWFGGYGIAGTGGFFEGLGFRPGRFFAALAHADNDAINTPAPHLKRRRLRNWAFWQAENLLIQLARALRHALNCPNPTRAKVSRLRRTGLTRGDIGGSRQPGKINPETGLLG